MKDGGLLDDYDDYYSTGSAIVHHFNVNGNVSIVFLGIMHRRRFSVSVL